MSSDDDDDEVVEAEGQVHVLLQKVVVGPGINMKFPIAPCTKASVNKEEEEASATPVPPQMPNMLSRWKYSKVTCLLLFPIHVACYVPM